MLKILQEMQATQKAGHNNAERHNEGGGIETSPVTTIGAGVKTGTVKHQITSYSNEQKNRSTIGSTAYAITNQVHATGRHRDIRIMRLWQIGWGAQTLFVGN